MRMRSVYDIESSSNGKVAVLEELEDVMFQVCSSEEGLLFPYCAICFPAIGNLLILKKLR